MHINRDKNDKFNVLFILEFLDFVEGDSGPFILMENGSPIQDEAGSPIKTEE